MLFDNTLWSGEVANPETRRKTRWRCARLNDALHHDERVDVAAPSARRWRHARARKR
jgi:predicted O-methyltransferase YrrM